MRENFSFIGLVEAWDESICLFHRQFGGTMHKNEFTNLRPADLDRYSGRFRLASEEDLHELSRDDDPYDYEVYELARELFVQRLRAYRIRVPDNLVNPPDIYS